MSIFYSVKNIINLLHHMKILGNLLILLLCSFSVFSQNNLTLSGSLIDKADNEPIISGSLELLNSKDSSYVAGTISNANGGFTFRNLSPSKYILKATYVGYLPLFKDVSLNANQPTLNLGKLSMETNDILLQEAVVEGKRPEIVVKNDTIEYDAASYKTTENAVVEDLLKKLPGVEVDQDGKITVAGKEVKKFLVDGKEFFSDDPQVASKNLPAEMVEKLQVVDRKSEQARMTGFDDGEEETIINLTVKQGMKQGTMGNVLAGLGADVEKDNDLRYQGAAFVNHMRNNDRYTLILGGNNNNNMGAADLGANQFGGMRMRRGAGGGIAEAQNFMLSINKEFSKTLDLNGDIRFNGSDRNSITKVEQTTLSEIESQLDKTNTYNDYFSQNLSANFRLEWKPDTLNTLIFRPNIRYNRSHSDETEASARFNYNTLDTIFDSNSTAYNKGNGINFGGNLDYAHKFQSKPGRVISINMRGNFNDNESRENYWWLSHKYKDGIYDSDEERNQRSENDNNVNTYRGSLSYVEPINAARNNFIQVMYRLSYSETKDINSTYDIYEFDPLLLESIARTDTAVINGKQSRSTLRNVLDQRIGVSFKAVREKYNYTIGFNVDPSRSLNETYQPSEGSIPIQYLPYPYDSRLANIRGDSLISSIKQNIVNFSPVVNFNYIFGQRTNLRIDYEGETTQPSATQLRDYSDESRPTEITQGNPDLKPGYENSLRIRFQKYVAATQLMYNFNFNGGFSVNDIASVTEMLEDGRRLTTYENVNGNWNANLMGMFNMPLRNKKFTIGSFARIGYSNRNSFVNESENLMKNFSIMDNVNINYRSDLFDIGINASLNYSYITYSAQPERNQNTYNYRVGGYTTWYLPKNWTVESDINWTGRSGYAEGFNIPETIWNAAVTKQLFNKSFGTGSLKLQIYDILQDRNSITASATTNGYRTVETNVIPSYFMCSFIYKFSLFPKSSSATEKDMMPQDRFRGGPSGPPPGGGRRPF